MWVKRREIITGNAGSRYLFYLETSWSSTPIRALEAKLYFYISNDKTSFTWVSDVEFVIVSKFCLEIEMFHKNVHVSMKIMNVSVWHSSKMPHRPRPRHEGEQNLPFGVRIILSWRPLRRSTSKKSSLPSRHLPKSRTLICKGAPSPLFQEGQKFITRGSLRPSSTQRGHQRKPHNKRNYPALTFHYPV